MEISLKDKVILVTGASSGIGKSIVESLTESEATVAIHYHSNKKSAEDLAFKAGNNSQIFASDISNPKQVISLFHQVISTYRKLDVLINNAGIYQYAPIVNMDWLEKWQQTIATNLTSAGILCKMSIEHFLGNGGGRIINIASRAAFRGDTGDYMAYAASKGALISLSKTIAKSYGKDNIKAFSIAPGFVRTPMAQEFIDKNGEDIIMKELALNKLTEPEDVAPIITFIAAGMMDHATGSTIDINAGSYMR